MTDYYILKDKKAIPVSNVIEWAEQFEKLNRVVKHDELGGVRVSTVFLGLNHGWNGEVLLFETMIFGGGA